jgi:uncharacterized protein Yka (UPF0111/DUF47 family)
MAIFKLPRLLPREDKFCVLLEQLATEASTCARHFRVFVDRRDSGAAEAISACRAKSKLLAAEVTKELCLTFVTPFDREDMQDIAATLYKIPKTIEKVKDRMALPGLASDHQDFLRQIDLIVREAEAMESMVRDLVTRRNAQQVQSRVAELYDLEHQGDVVLGDLLASLFKNNTDPRDLILRKDIYDMLEKIIDRYRDAAGIALQMVLKHT